jgi:Nucleotidyl transferase AbiEii toxin, Type IV TA system
MSIGPYGSPNALRRGLNHQIRIAAQRSSQPAQRIRRDFAHQRLLARVFSHEPDGWVLKGGVGLLVRLPEQARHSRDIDLVRQDGIEHSVSALEAAARVDLRDGLAFEFRRPKPGGRDAVVVPVEARVGATHFEGFTIDLLCGRPWPAAIERTTPQPVLELDYLTMLPPFMLYPLAAQIADKICAIYERHGPAAVPSTRYRDLVDLVLIATSQRLDGDAVAAALADERRRRRALQLPSSFEFPHPRWRDGYRAAGHDARLADGLADPDRAHALMVAFLDPLLRADPVTAWTPETHAWATDSALPFDAPRC